MATSPFDEPDFLEQEADYGPPPSLSEIFITDYKGDECVTAEGLNWIWPMDNREPLDIGGKGVFLPPTCELQLSCVEKFSHEYCLGAIFAGSSLPPQTMAPVPIGGSMTMALTAAAMLLLIKRKYK